MELPVVKGWGFWDIENLHLKYISDRWVQVSCEHKVINGGREIINIYHTFIDKMRGIDFENKVDLKLNAFIEKMKERNETISRLRLKTNELRSKSINAKERNKGGI